EFDDFTANGVHQISIQATRLSVATLDGNRRAFQPLLALMKKKADRRMLKITTQSGQSVTCSEDHPIKAGNHYLPAGQVQVKDALSCVFFRGVPHESIPNERVEAVWARILGVFMGDGTLTQSGKGKWRAAVYGKKSDLERIQDDLAFLGVKSRIIERTRSHRIVTQYGSRRFCSTNAELYTYTPAFCRELLNRGMPQGNKAFSVFGVPGWILNAPLWIQRLYLAGFFGAELSAPATHSKTGFYAPVVSQNKNEPLKQSGRLFLIQIMRLLEKFGVATTRISERLVVANRKGPVIRLRLEISADEDNLLRLWETVGFEYNEHRRQLAEAACRYIRMKKNANGERAAVDRMVKAYRQKGLSLKEIKALLATQSANQRFIERCYYEKAGQRIPLDFVSFKDFVIQCRSEFESFGALQDPVATVEQIDYSDWVYDISVAATRNFVADGIVVSNCGVRFLRTNFSVSDVMPKLSVLTDALFR
ncbi:MAG: hypothetical protein Q8P02_01025, partial [Candidatus Micrarchaeota archaeon]|nr:hypothetical protein [Candidatus Micrarchaeota archaeon]